jgi:hypothetical protein
LALKKLFFTEINSGGEASICENKYIHKLLTTMNPSPREMYIEINGEKGNKIHKDLNRQIK